MKAEGWQSLVAKTSSCSVSDVLMKQGMRQFMLQRLRQVGAKRVTGPALTISRRPANSGARDAALPNLKMLEAIASAPPGTVLVFDSPGTEAALWGGLLAATAVQRQLGGVVSDGPVRDPDEIAELGCPCFCTGAVPAGQAGLLELASIGQPLECAGVTVRTGDYLIGDASGVVVIPAGMEEAVLREAVSVEDRDRAAMAMLREGKGLLEVMQALGRA